MNMLESIKNNKPLIKLLQKAYSAERAAAFAYQGHAGSVKNKGERQSIRKIEIDEWNHRTEVFKLMNQYKISVSKFNEIKFYVIGKTISISCYIIGWFMPFYFAGNLESGNVCEYIRIMRLFNALGIYEHDEILSEMSIREKEHEVYFYEKVKNNKLLPFFENIFKWGRKSKNDIDLHKGFDYEHANEYCKHYGDKRIRYQKEIEKTEIKIFDDGTL